MKQYAEHGRVGVCHALRSDKLYVRSFNGGYPYLYNDMLVRSSLQKPIYSYGKNYKKNDKDFALFVWTTNADASDVEKIFESILPLVSDEMLATLAEDSGSVQYVN